MAACTLADVFLSFAGFKPPDRRIHSDIQALSPGDPLSLVHANGRWKVLDRKRRQVGRMATKWTLPDGMRIERARVHGIFTRWAKDDLDEDRRKRLRSKVWEVVVPELTLSRG